MIAYGGEPRRKNKWYRRKDCNLFLNYMCICYLFNVTVTQTYRPVSSKCRMTLNNKFDGKQKAAVCGMLQVGQLSWYLQERRHSMEVLGLGRRCSGRDRFVRKPYKYAKVKVKQSLYRFSQAVMIPGVWGSQISRQSALENDNISSPTHRPSLTRKIYFWYYFSQRLSRTLGRKDRVNKEFQLNHEELNSRPSVL
jgi:hypothetical protein